MVKNTKSKLRGLTLSLLHGERVLVRVGTVDIWLGVSEQAGTRSKVVIQAPKEVLILREAVLEKSHERKEIA